MAKADKEYTYYWDKHILFEGDVIVFKRPKSTPDEERERATITSANSQKETLPIICLYVVS